MEKRNDISQITGIKIKRNVALGACLLMCAGMCACGSEEEGSTPKYSVEETSEISAEGTELRLYSKDISGENKEDEIIDEEIIDEESEMSEDTAAHDAEIPADAGKAETETSGGKLTQGQEYYNKDLGFTFMVPEDWVVESAERRAELDDDILFLAHTSDHSEKVFISELQDCDGSVDGAARILKNPEAYRNAMLQEIPELDDCEVDTIEANGIEYVLTVEHYTRGEYSGFYIYGAKDGMYNVNIVVYTPEKERIKEIMGNMTFEK